MFSSADLTCVLLAGAAIERLRRSSRAQRIARRAGGAILIGLGANLALQRQ
jgi:threonine/homoserine/homoserine lactone efflux protein